MVTTGTAQGYTSRRSTGEELVWQMQGSMLQKMEETNRMRAAAAGTEAESIAEIAVAVAGRLDLGGKIVAFGNGGSATDANDLIADCAIPPSGMEPVPAVSLSAESANITAIANDIGTEAIFTRQLIAHARPEDVAVGISTSGGSANILAAFAEARKRGLLTVALVDMMGGRIVSEKLADHAVVVRSDYIPLIQEVQASVYHVDARPVGRTKRRGLALRYAEGWRQARSCTPLAPAIPAQ